jgi:hypothetical protein
VSNHPLHEKHRPHCARTKQHFNSVKASSHDPLTAVWLRLDFFWTIEPLIAMTMGETSFLTPLHPYYPLHAIIDPYLENEWHFITLLAIFAAGCVTIFSATNLVVKRVRPNLSTSELLTILWFVLSGCIHLFFEGKGPHTPSNPSDPLTHHDRVLCVQLPKPSWTAAPLCAAMEGILIF